MGLTGGATVDRELPGILGKFGTGLILCRRRSGVVDGLLVRNQLGSVRGDLGDAMGVSKGAVLSHRWGLLRRTPVTGLCLGKLTMVGWGQQILVELVCCGRGMKAGQMGDNLAAGQLGGGQRRSWRYPQG